MWEPSTNFLMDIPTLTHHFSSPTTIQVYAILEIAFSNLTYVETCITSQVKTGPRLIQNTSSRRSLRFIKLLLSDFINNNLIEKLNMRS